MESCSASLTFKQIFCKFGREVIPSVYLGCRQRWALLLLLIDAFKGTAELKLLHFLPPEGFAGCFAHHITCECCCEASCPEICVRLGWEATATPFCLSGAGKQLETCRQSSVAGFTHNKAPFD